MYVDSWRRWLRKYLLKNDPNGNIEPERIKLIGEVKKVDEGPVDFERAISLTGYGKFNFCLLLAVLPAGWASIFSSSSMSYVLPSAECDLRLTMFDKGLLNSMSFAGMIVSSFFWGFVADAFGRKKLMVYGYLCTALVNIASCFSRVSWVLIIFKFINGVVISGPYAALMSYLAEIHDEQHRSRVYMWLGVFFSLGNISLPCLAWLIIPQNWQWNFFNGSIEINSWRVFLAVCTIPEFTACIVMSRFPESPRFLLSKGRLDESLKIFQTIYSINTGEDPEKYPVTKLESEEVTEKTSNNGALELIKNGLQIIKPLFLRPNVFKLFLIGSIQFGATMGSNSLRLWMPQLFAMIETYESTHKGSNYEQNPSFCKILDSTKPSKMFSNNTIMNSTLLEDSETCTGVIVNSTVYINSIVIALTAVIGYTLAGSLINIVGKKAIMVICFLSAGSCCGLLYWAGDANGILGISSIFVAMSSIGGATVINVIVDNFPTYLRTMAVSVTMMMGRVGAVTGNLLFPVLLAAGCFGPFIMIGTACLVCAFLVLFVSCADQPEKKKSSTEV